MSSFKFEPYESWEDVLRAARTGNDVLWYQAPFDRSPKMVIAVKVYKNGSIRIDPLSNQASKFTANVGHFDRFRRRVAV